MVDRNLDETNSELIPYRKGDKYGFCLKDKTIVIDCIYDEVTRFQNGTSIVKKDGLYGLLDSRGNTHILGKYNIIQHSFEGLRLVGTERGRGFIDTDYNEVIPCKYRIKRGSFFSEGVVVVQNAEEQSGFLDVNSNLIVECIYDNCGNFKDGLAVVSNGKRHFSRRQCGVIDKCGSEIIKLKYDSLSSFNEGLAANELSGKWGFIDKNENQVLPLIYDEVQNEFSEGFAGVYTEDELWYFIDREGNGLIHDKPASDLCFDALINFENKLAPVAYNKSITNDNNKTWGIIDNTGNNVIDFKYDKISTFNDGLALVEINGRVGYIDVEENLRVPIKYVSGSNFYEGLAWVQVDEKRRNDINYIGLDNTEYWED